MSGDPSHSFGMTIRIYSYIAAQLAAEQARLFYWVPVILGLGIAAYFSLDGEPSIFIGGFLLTLSAIGFVMTQRSIALGPYMQIFFLIAVVLALGAFVAQFRAMTVGTQFLSDKIGPVSIEGTIQSIDREEEGGRAVLNDLQFDFRRPFHGTLPNQARLKIQKSAGELQIGDRIRTLAIIAPPNGPAVPGGYNFARQLYFDGIGAVGFTMGAPEIIASKNASGFMMRVNSLRDSIIQTIYKDLDGDTAAVTAALITSEQSGVSDQAIQDLRQSGLQHILSVSGLHLTLLGGFVFFLVRFLLMWVPGLAVAAKKIAAFAALLATFFYLTISGFAVPTQRSFVMIGLVFLAVLLDREALSMRLVAIAALIILILRPESVLHVSFQLSFAAVIALIAAYETWQRQDRGQRAWYAKVAEYFVLAAMTSFIASLATAPLIAYHFHQLTLQGILANTLVGPLVTFWIMPLVVIVLLALPMGLAQGPLTLIGYGVDAMMNIARTIADLPGSQIIIPAISTMSVLLMVFGGLWLMLWMRPWRYWGLVPIALGLMLAWHIELPDVMINADASLIAVKTGDETVALSSLKKDKFIAQIWNKYYGQADSIDWRQADLWDSGNKNLRCDSLACIYSMDGQIVSFVAKPQAFAEDCSAANVIVTPLYAPRHCSAKVILDRAYFKENGIAALAWRNGKWRVNPVDVESRNRPWHGM